MALSNCDDQSGEYTIIWSKYEQCSLASLTYQLVKIDTCISDNGRNKSNGLGIFLQLKYGVFARSFQSDFGLKRS